MVKFEAIIPVLAEDRADAVAIATDFLDEEAAFPTRWTIRSAPAQYRSQFSDFLAGRRPVNGARLGPTCREIVTAIERQREIDDKVQLKLFE